MVTWAVGEVTSADHWFPVFFHAAEVAVFDGDVEGSAVVPAEIGIVVASDDSIEMHGAGREPAEAEDSIPLVGCLVSLTLD